MPRKTVPASLAVLIALAATLAAGATSAEEPTPPKPPEAVVPAATPPAPPAPDMPTATAPAATETPAATPAPAPAAAAEPAPVAPAPSAPPAAAPTPEMPASSAPAPVGAAPAPAPAAPVQTAPTTPPAPAVVPAPPPPPVAAPAPPPAKSTAVAPEKALFAARPVLSLSGNGTWESAEDRLGAAFEQLAAAAKKAGVKPTGAPLVQYLESDDERFSFVAMLPVDKRTKAKLPKGIKADTSPAGPALRFTPATVGDDLEEIYARIDDYLVAHDMTLATMVEEYGEDAIDSPEDRVVVQIWVFVE